MKIAVFGSGYVGLTVGTCLANLGNNIVCVDVDKKKIDNLNNGIIPIYEPGLSEMIKCNVDEDRLIFTLNAEKAIKENDVIFIGVGTPQDENGKADLKYIKAVAETIGDHIDGYKVIVTKSTVPVGTNHKIKKIISQKYSGEFDVCSNPEFLKEGTAIKDFLAPDRIVVGIESDRAEKIMRKLYKDLERINRPILFTDIRSAELIKYASNSFLAIKISFMNEVANLCEKSGADVKEVIKGMGLDTRIGHRFLQPGVGYGGSCFPKDVRALVKTGEFHGSDFFILEAVEKVNRKQKTVVIPKLIAKLGDLENKNIAVLGLSFKPKTDDMREAPSVEIITTLIEHGANVKTYDPIALENAKSMLPDEVVYSEDAYATLDNADALVIVTEWDEFRGLSRKKMLDLMKQPIIIDGRNIYDKEEMLELGFDYQGIGR